MGKNIVLCSDGTGNQVLKGRGTNVFKIYEAVDRHDPTTQIAFYDDGVGTENLKLLKLLGGAFGFGLSRNVRELYTHLACSYEPGDDIYLFGFSRGAYTVRTLAGFIAKCGILDVKQCRNSAEVARRVKGAYKAYRHGYKTIATTVWRFLFGWLTQWRYGFTTVDEYKQYTHEDGDARIRFVGVWDTVGAVGFPIIGVAKFIDSVIFKFRFPTTELSPKVLRACHAVSIDDKRKTFEPEMWDERGETHGRIQQVWFSGVHANVGGGYPKHGISLVSLDWMMKQASAAGLKFVEHDALFYQQHADVHDKLYDSRAGLAGYYRYEPRNIHEICRKNGIEPKVHESVYRRSISLTDSYAPGNLPKGLRFVSSAGEGFVLERESAEIDDVLDGDTSLLGRVTGWIWLRKSLQLIFYVLTAIVVYLLAQEQSIGLISKALGVDQSVGAWVEILKVLYYSGLLIPVVVVLALSHLARGKIQDTFSAFWYGLKKNSSS